MSIPVYASTGAFVTRKNNRDYHLIERVAPELSADGIEFMMYTSWDSIAIPLAKELRRTGVNFPVMHMDKRIGEVLAEGDDGYMAEAARMFQRDVDMACVIGAETLVLHLWSGPRSDARFDIALEAYAVFAELAEARGLKLTIENVICMSGLALNRLRELRDKFPNIRFTYDTKMAQFRGENELIRLKEWDWLFRDKHAAHLHANDCDGSVQSGRQALAVLHYGEGNVDFDSFFEYVRGTGFSGSATVESTSCLEDGTVETDKLNRSLESVRAGLNK